MGSKEEVNEERERESERADGDGPGTMGGLGSGEADSRPVKGRRSIHSYAELPRYSLRNA